MKKKLLTLFIIGMILFIALSGTYLGMGFYYRDHFMENTIINGRNVADLTVEQAEELLAGPVEGYEIALVKKDGTREKITGEQISYGFVLDGDLQGFLEEQNILQWMPRYLGERKEYTVTVRAAYDEVLLEQVLTKLDCFNVNKVTKPRDAELIQLDNGTWRINPEREGNQLKKERVLEVLKEAIVSGDNVIDLESEDCYEKPAVYSDDEALNAQKEEWNGSVQRNPVLNQPYVEQPFFDPMVPEMEPDWQPEIVIIG